MFSSTVLNYRYALVYGPDTLAHYDDVSPGTNIQLIYNPTFCHFFDVKLPFN